MRELLKKLLHGFLFGTGFGLALWVVTYFAMIQLQQYLQNDIADLNGEYTIEQSDITIGTSKQPIITSDIPISVPVTEDTKLHLQSSKAIVTGIAIEIVGTLINESLNNYRSVQLEAELFDAAGNYIYECVEYLHEDLPPGKTLNFKVSCHPLTRELSESYSDYKLLITSVSMLRK